MAQESHVRVRLLVPSLDALKGLEIDSGCMPRRRREDGQIEIEALVPERTLTKLKRMKSRKVNVERLPEPATERLEVSAIVSRTNRYADGSLPQGLGRRKK